MAPRLRAGRLARVPSVSVAFVIVIGNLIGVAVVLALTLLVIPLPGERELPWWTYVAAAGAYVAFAVPVGIVKGLGSQAVVRRWAKSGAEATPQIRRAILRMPSRLFGLQVALWGGAAFLFAVVESFSGIQRAVWVAVVIVLTGVSTAAVAYLFTERLTRNLAARAFADVGPAELEVGRGVAMRSVLAWALGSGIPTVGLMIVGIRGFTQEDISRGELLVTIVVLAGTALVIGVQTVILAARATADPIKAVAKALAQVGEGDFDLQIPVYDGTEIGRLQAGFNQMVAGLAERERIRAAFGTYVDPGIVDHILRAGTDLAGEELEVSAMFLDIRNFTGFAERTPAPQVVGTINRLFERAVPIIRDHGGHVDKFVGDGLLAVFGAPRRLPDHADRALGAARAIAAAVEDEFHGSLSVGIGVNTGSVVAGNVGGAGRFEFSVIGDAVNVAARIEAATRTTGDTVLISERTRELLTSGAEQLVERPGIALKGKSAPVSLYGIAGI